MTMYFTVPTGDVVELEYCHEADRLREVYPNGFLQAVDPRTQYLLKKNGWVIGIFDNEFIAYKHLRKINDIAIEYSVFDGFSVEPRDLTRLYEEEQEYLEYLNTSAQRSA